jgi:hypothetical protein
MGNLFHSKPIDLSNYSHIRNIHLAKCIFSLDFIIHILTTSLYINQPSTILSILSYIKSSPAPQLIHNSRLWKRASLFSDEYLFIKDKYLDFLPLLHSASHIYLSYIKSSYKYKLKHNVSFNNSIQKHIIHIRDFAEYYLRILHIPIREMKLFASSKQSHFSIQSIPIYSHNSTFTFTPIPPTTTLSNNTRTVIPLAFTVSDDDNDDDEIHSYFIDQHEFHDNQPHLPPTPQNSIVSSSTITASPSKYFPSSDRSSSSSSITGPPSKYFPSSDRSSISDISNNSPHPVIKPTIKSPHFERLTNDINYTIQEAPNEHSNSNSPSNTDNDIHHEHIPTLSFGIDHPS